jgi:hypothetical protein
MYACTAREVLGTAAGREFLAYILRKLKYCDVITTRKDMEVRNAGIGILEDLMDITGITATVLKIE